MNPLPPTQPPPQQPITTTDSNPITPPPGQQTPPLNLKNSLQTDQGNDNSPVIIIEAKTNENDTNTTKAVKNTVALSKTKASVFFKSCGSAICHTTGFVLSLPLIPLKNESIEQKNTRRKNRIEKAVGEAASNSINNIAFKAGSITGTFLGSIFGAIAIPPAIVIIALAAIIAGPPILLYLAGAKALNYLKNTMEHHQEKKLLDNLEGSINKSNLTVKQTYDIYQQLCLIKTETKRANTLKNKIINETEKIYQKKIENLTESSDALALLKEIYDTIDMFGLKDKYQIEKPNILTTLLEKIENNTNNLLEQIKFEKQIDSEDAFNETIKLLSLLYKNQLIFAVNESTTNFILEKLNEFIKNNLHNVDELKKAVQAFNILKNAGVNLILIETTINDHFNKTKKDFEESIEEIIEKNSIENITDDNVSKTKETYEKIKDKLDQLKKLSPLNQDISNLVLLYSSNRPKNASELIDNPWTINNKQTALEAWDNLKKAKKLSLNTQDNRKYNNRELNIKHSAKKYDIELK